MGYRWLPRYAPTIRVTPEEAKHDKIGIEFGVWRLQATDPTSFHTFYAALSGPPSDFAVGRPFSDEQAEASWFSRTSGAGLYNQELTVRQGGRGRGARAGRPIVGGVLRTRTGRPQAEAAQVAHVKEVRFDAQLNPTRFVQYQPRREWITQRTRPPSEWELPPPTLLAGARMLTDLDEHSLDGNDNILMGRAAMLYSRPDAWPMHLARYWHAVSSKIDDLISEAAFHAGLGLAIRPNFNLKSVETYWEFAIEDPVSWIREIEPLLTAMGLSSEARSYGYPDGFAGEAVEANCRSQRIRLRPGTWLRVYAKTDRRVRFEIEHVFRENSDVLGGRHTSGEQDAFFGWLELVTARAATEINRVLERLESAGARDANQVSVTQLVIAVTQAVRDEATASRVLALLASNGFLSVTVGSGLQTIVRQLRSREIVEPSERNRSVYVLAPRFQTAARWLAQRPPMP